MAVALDASMYDALLGSLADVVLDHVPGEAHLTVRVGHGLPLSFALAGDDVRPVWQRWVRRIVDADRRRVVEGLAQARGSRQLSWIETYLGRRDDGTVRSVAHRVLFFRPPEGGLLREVHVITDTTAQWQDHELLLAERRELETRVAERTRALAEKNLELARALSHKDDFLASMSHELRTPLNAVLGLTDALLEGLAGSLAPQQRTWLADIASSGQHLLGVINDILDLARIDAGRFEPDPQPVAVEDLAHAAVRLVMGNAIARGVRLTEEVLPDLGIIVTDPRAARQVLLNILGNAVKFTPAGKAVSVHVARGDVPGTVVFTIADEGPGIPDDRLQDIFRPFVQLDGGLDRREGGTGLGLALAARMVRAIGGSILVESTVGQGSTFRVTLGVPDGETDEHPVGTDTEGEGEAGPVFLRPGTRVLVADDNDANVDVLRGYLEAKHFVVRTVTDGRAAVDETIAWRPDVVLMDIQMPLMDGLQATRLIREHPEVGRTPIVAVTALAMPGDRERCLEAGVNVYVAKPVRLRELLRTLTSLFTEP